MCTCAWTFCSPIFSGTSWDSGKPKEDLQPQSGCCSCCAFGSRNNALCGPGDQETRVQQSEALSLISWGARVEWLAVALGHSICQPSHHGHLVLTRSTQLSTTGLCFLPGPNSWGPHLKWMLSLILKASPSQKERGAYG